MATHLLYLAQIDHAQDVWLGIAIQNSPSLPGDIFIFRAKWRQQRLDPPRPAQGDRIFILEQKIMSAPQYLPSSGTWEQSAGVSLKIQLKILREQI